MRNFKKGGKSTIAIQLPETMEFKKTADYVGDYKKGEFKIHGFLKTHSDLYNKEQYSLVCEYKKKVFFMNVPSWYGSRLETDFEESGETAETYFGGVSVAMIEEFTTKYNTTSYNVVIHE